MMGRGEKKRGFSRCLSFSEQFKISNEFTIEDEYLGNNKESICSTYKVSYIIIVILTVEKFYLSSI